MKTKYISALLTLLLLTCVLFAFNVSHAKYQLKHWYNNNIDKNTSGLTVVYYNNKDFVGNTIQTETAEKLLYSSTTNSNFSRNNFSLRAVGFFLPPETGRYKFFLEADDAARLYIDNKVIVDNIIDGNIYPDREMHKTTRLKKGPHLIVIEYFQSQDKANLSFSWLRTNAGERSHDLGLFFKPVKSNFQWGRDIQSFQNIINYRKIVNICLLYLAVGILLLWPALYIFKTIGHLILSAGNHPLIGRLAPYFTILASGIIAYRKIMFSTGPAPAIEANDTFILFYPVYFFVKQAFLSGQIPFWDPHTFFGQPLLFNFGLGLTYFPLIISLFFSGHAYFIPRHLELLVVFHLVFTGITMYWGLRKIGLNKAGACLGGIIFQLFIGIREAFVWPPISFGLLWVPLCTFYFFACVSKLNKWNKLKDGAILLFSYFMLISAGHPHLLAYTYFQTFLITLFFITKHLLRKNIREAFNCLKKSIFYPLAPVLLASFIILPTLKYLPEAARWIKAGAGDSAGIGPLYKSYFVTLILPIITWRFSSPYAYTGILTILFAFGYCLLIKKTSRKQHDLIWILLIIFWALFSIDESPLYSTVLKYVPFMQTMRFSQRGMIFYTLSTALLAGKFFDVLCYENYRLKLQKSIFLILPLFLALMLIYTGNKFLALIHDYPIKFDYNFLIVLSSIILFVLTLFIHNRSANAKFRAFIKIFIPIWFIAEILILTSQCPSINYSSGKTYHPYDAIWQEYKQKYSDIYNGKLGLYRIENYDEPLIAPYYFNTYSVHGYLSQATHPSRYYYLWNTHGGWFSYRYNRFWDLSYLPFYSPLYDLMGVKYFITEGGTEALPLPREIRGQGEWIEGRFPNRNYISRLRIYNTKDDTHRRISKGRLDLDGKTVINFNMPLESGWHEFNFNPKLSNKFKLTINEVKSQIWNGTDGVTIGELELYNSKNEKVQIDPDSLKDSSHFWHNEKECLIDNDPEKPWQSGCDIALRNMMETDTVQQVRRGIFINKNVLPRAFIVRKIKVFDNITGLAGELHSKDLDPANTLLLEKLPEKQIEIEQLKTNDKIEIINYNLNKIEIEADISSPGYLVLTDTYLPGWSALINGKNTEILRAYGYFRAVALEKGRNKIVFHYFPPLLTIGIIISLITLIALSLLAVKTFKREKILC